MNSPNFGRDKEKLLKTLARFDGSISAGDASEDVIDGRSRCQVDSRHYHSFFMHILLENICNSIEPDDHKREVLFREVCSRLSEAKILNDSLDLDSLQPIRKKVAEQFYNFVKQIHSKLSPVAGYNNIDASPFLNEISLSPELELQYRYEQNFEELEVIAKGGFGLVCKAKHKVTELVYAVKKIIFKYKSDAEYLKVVREAKNIAALNHPNVVSYNNAWIECLPSSEYEQIQSGSSSSDSKSSSDSSDSDFLEEPLPWSSKSFQARKEEILDKHASSVPDNWIEENLLKLSGALEGSFSFLNVKAQRRRERSASDSTVLNNRIPDQLRSPDCLNIRVMLCIQMEYCNCDLRLWLDKRAEGKELPFEMDVTKIFQDILNGVVHIHSKNIIHRDLKPQNIFFSEASHVLKIGDFGLATLSSCASDVRREKMSKKHSANLGTVPYAAPEQINGSLYDSKVDVYSLGIILFELLNVFSTKMEFYKAINEILKGHFPKDMVTKWPLHTNLVKNLTNRNPRDRMSAQEILNQLQSMESPQAQEIQSLKIAINEKDDEIIRLRALVNEQQSIISRQNIDLQK